MSVISPHDHASDQSQGGGPPAPAPTRHLTAWQIFVLCLVVGIGVATVQQIISRNSASQSAPASPAAAQSVATAAPPAAPAPATVAAVAPAPAPVAATPTPAPAVAPAALSLDERLLAWRTRLTPHLMHPEKWPTVDWNTQDLAAYINTFTSLYVGAVPGDPGRDFMGLARQPWVSDGVVRNLDDPLHAYWASDGTFRTIDIFRYDGKGTGNPGDTIRYWTVREQIVNSNYTAEDLTHDPVVIRIELYTNPLDGYLYPLATTCGAAQC